MTTFRHRIAAALGTLTMCITAVTAAPPDLHREYAEQLADLRNEITTIDRELDEQEIERAVAARVIELASADLEKTDDDSEAERIRRIIRQYRDRLERVERDRGQLTEHRVRVLEAIARLEVRFETVERERAAREAAEAVRERAERIRRLERPRGARPMAANDDEHESALRKRQRTLSQIEALRLALPAFLEANDRHAAERLELAIRFRELALEGHDDDDEHRDLRAAAPGHDELRELLALAAELWHTVGHEGRAETIERMTEALWSGKRDRDRAVEDRVEHTAPLANRIERLQDQLARIAGIVEAMNDELSALKRQVRER